METQELDLSEFLKNPGAHGYAFGFNGRQPVLQLHLFEDVYTLCWLSEVKLPSGLYLIARILDEVHEARMTELKAQGIPSDWLVALVTRVQEDHLLDEITAMPLAQSPSYVIEQRFAGRLDGATSLYLRFGSSARPWGSFALWTDTELESDYRETGLTALRPSPLPTQLHTLLMESAPWTSQLEAGHLETVLETVDSKIARP